MGFLDGADALHQGPVVGFVKLIAVLAFKLDAPIDEGFASSMQLFDVHVLAPSISFADKLYGKGLEK